MEIKMVQPLFHKCLTKYVLGKAERIPRMVTETIFMQLAEGIHVN